MSDTKKTPTKRPIRHLTSAQKAEAIALWKSGTVTLSDLVKRFKKNESTLLRLFAKEGVKRGEAREETEKKVQEAVAKAIVSDSTVHAERIRETKEDHYKMASGLSKLTWSLIVKATQEKRPMGTLAADMKALQLAANILKTTREERYAVLDIIPGDTGDDKDVPPLTVQELTAEDIKTMHRQQMLQADDDLGVGDLGDLGDDLAPLDDRVETD